MLQDEDDYSSTMQLGRKGQYTAPLNILNDIAREDKVNNAASFCILINLCSFVLLVLTCKMSVYQDDCLLQDYDPLADHRRPTVAQNENEYRQNHRRKMILSPTRHDPFAIGEYLCTILSVVSISERLSTANYMWQRKFFVCCIFHVF